MIVRLRDSWRRRRLPALLRAWCALAVVALPACAASDGATGSDGGPVTIEVPTLPPGTTIEPAQTSPPTEPIDTAPPTSAARTEPPSTPAPTPSTAPAPPPLITAPQGTEPLFVSELVLTGEALGSAVFGADPDGVVEYVASVLGAPTDDTGWVAPDAFADCVGDEAVRKVEWGALALLFSDKSNAEVGRRHFIGYEYGRVSQIGDEPAGLRTPGGVTLGSRVVDLLAEFPDAVVNEGDDEVGIPDSFYVSDLFWGLLTGTTTEDYVTVLFGGDGCFE